MADNPTTRAALLSEALRDCQRRFVRASRAEVLANFADFAECMSLLADHPSVVVRGDTAAQMIGCTLAVLRTVTPTGVQDPALLPVCFHTSRGW